MTDIKKTLGGDRLGSGNRMKQELHNFYRSNHNLSAVRATSMAAGVLYPLYTQVGLKGDTFNIDLSAFVRTLPTQGPLFGSFKLQADVFQIPFRLYQAILHNNTTEIGMEMDQVLLPKIKLKSHAQWLTNEKKWKQQHARSSLVNYIGISGIGTPPSHSSGDVSRKFNAIPLLAYYDIFKNYYSNKQEENAYVITNKEKEISTLPYQSSINGIFTEPLIYPNNMGWSLQISGESDIYSIIRFVTDYEAEDIISVSYTTDQVNESSLRNVINGNVMGLYCEKSKFNGRNSYVLRTSGIVTDLGISAPMKYTTYADDISLEPFELKNIDTMRKNLLTKWELGEEFVWEKGNEESDFYPYSAITNYDDIKKISMNEFPMNGLVVKTYQSDMYNNWLDTEWVNKITELSAVSTTSGSFTIDALNFAKKVYNHYNRIAISGGTYDDWQEAVYGDKVWGKSEKPIYCGGFSSEVVFDEVVSTAATEINADNAPLGSLGGRGSLTGDKGGHVVIKVNEASIIMVMVSLTPRICYGQGNAWYMTELDSMDDLHKPMFDRIGFQDLLVENMAWWSTKISSTSGVIARPSVGKQPAWVHYMTDINKVYGDFAEEDGKAFMVLQRIYGTDNNGSVKDVTTYIDPSMYNYAFAVNELQAQNFWTFLKLDIQARRKMSATQIPNL